MWRKISETDEVLLKRLGTSEDSDKSEDILWSWRAKDRSRSNKKQEEAGVTGYSSLLPVHLLGAKVKEASRGRGGLNSISKF